MKIKKKLRLVMAVSVMVLIVSADFLARGETIDPTAPRAWRAYGGHTITAGFVEIKGDNIVLKAEDGTLRNVPLRMLIPEDQAIANELGIQVASGGGFAVKPGSGNRLAAFADGPGKGQFALYENEKFVVRISPGARISIQCLEAGKPVGKPIGVELGHVYWDSKLRPRRRRKIVSFVEAYHPVLQPDVVTLEGFLEPKIPFGFTLAFEGQSIHLSGWVDDPAPSSTLSDYSLALKFAASHSFEAHVLVADQKETLQPFSLEVNPLKGKAFTLPYGDRVKRIDLPLRTVDVKGPVFGPRRLSLSVGPSRAGEMRFSLQTGSPPFTGFAVMLQKNNKALRDLSCRITLTID